MMGKVIMSCIVPQLTGPRAGLPDGYVKLAYIRSGGTQYIDTGFKPNQNSGVTIDFQLTEVVSAWQGVWGARNVATNVGTYALWHSGVEFGFYYASANTTWSGLADTGRHVIQADKNTAVADGSNSVSIGASSFACNYTMFLFAVNSVGSVTCAAKMKLYSCQIYDNGTLVRDFVPCINESGAVGLYDLVGKKFYGNAGTGVFTGRVAEPEGILAGDLAVGSTVKLMENGAAVEYIVVHQGCPSANIYDPSCDGTWLLRKDIESNRVWNTSANYRYGSSSMAQYVDGTFLNRFDANTKEQIKTVKIPFVTSASGTTASITQSTDKAFLLSAIETGVSPRDYLPYDGAKLSYFTDSNSSRIAKLNGAVSPWWTRSAKYNITAGAWFLNLNGSPQGATVNTNEYGVRPALILPSEALFDEETLLLKEAT